MEFIKITNQEKEILNSLEPTYTTVLEQFPEEAEFLFALAYREKLTKVLELGVSTGASSVLLSHALKASSSNAKLYSVDYSERWYIHPEHKTGVLMEEVYPEFRDNWTLFTGGLVANFIDKIGGDIDLVFLDTSHILPGELLDFLMVLPYLKEDCLVVIHESNSHTSYPHSTHIVNNILMSSIKGTKILPAYAQSFYSENRTGKNFNFDNIILVEGRFLLTDALEQKNRHCTFTFPNVGAVRLNKDIRKNLWEFFNLFSLTWEYIPNEKDYNIIKKHFSKHYDDFYCSMFESAYHFAKFIKAFDVESSSTYSH